FALEELKHFRTVFEEGIHGLFVIMFASLVAQISPCELQAVAAVAGVAQWVVGDPQHSTGKRGGATETIRFLDYDHIQPCFFRSNRGAQAASPRADNKHIADTVHGRLLAKPGRGNNAIGMLSNPPSTSSSAPLT